MRLSNRPTFVAGAAAMAAALASVSAHAAVNVTVHGSDDLYNATGYAFEGTDPVKIDVTGRTSISFAVSSGSVTVNVGSGTNYSDADGVGSVGHENVYAAGVISSIVAPTAGFIAGAFVGSAPGTVPAGLTYTTSDTSFTSASPLLQQAFFIGDGLTGDGTGATQTFYVPTGATTLYLGVTDSCNYNGYPSCYNDNQGSFKVTVNGVGSASAVPEPASVALMIAGLGGIGAVIRRRARKFAA